MAALAQLATTSSRAPRRPCAAATAATAAASPTPRRCLQQQPAPSNQPRPRRVVAVAATDFHQSLLVATERPADLAPLPGGVAVREAEADDELQAAAWLRTLSFYRYPEGRKFAAQVHRTMVAEEEYKALKVARLNRKLDGGKPDTRERSACLVALAAAAGLPSSQEDPLDERLLVGGGGSSSSSALVGTLDVHAVKALPGEVLIGSSSNAAYLANVCTATAARRRGVGAALLQAARDLALSWGVEDLYVHTMAVNEIAVAFYERHGFVVEKEESSNQAHYRGRCLDGIEGRGRTLLLRDGRLRG